MKEGSDRSTAMSRVTRGDSRKPPRGAAAGALILGLAVAFAPSVVSAFDVDSTADTVDANPGDSVCADASGACTLRAAIMEANALALPGIQNINLPPGTYLLTIPTTLEDASVDGDLDITTAVGILGTDEATTIVQIERPTVNDRVFHVLVGAGVPVAFSRLTVMDGNLDDQGSQGGGIRIENGQVTFDRVAIVHNATQHKSLGGGLYIRNGDVHMVDCLVDDNFLPDNGGGGPQNRGAGIMVASPSDPTTIPTVLMERCTISNNTAERGAGGGMAVARGTTTLRNCTVALNDAGCDAGGMEVGPEATIVCNNCTIAGNSADGSQGCCGTGGGIYNFGGTMTIGNSIVADNIPDIADAQNDECPDVDGALDSLGWNIIGDLGPAGEACCNQPTLAATDLTGNAGLEQDVGGLPLLKDNGGRTPTIALLVGSIALDSADNASCEVEDQRTFPRPAEGDGTPPAVCDRGAFEGCTGDPDADGDGISDVCDCSPLDPTNPAPSEVGNSVVVDPGPAGRPTTLEWEAVAGATAYNVYRGFLTQGRVFVYNHQCILNGITVTSAMDALDPKPYSLFYYLVSTACGPSESGLGFAMDPGPSDRPLLDGCPAPTLDFDGDGTIEPVDNCPGLPNPGQEDIDNDSHGDDCDNCISIFNPTQSNIDGDALGDACDPDMDGDGIANDQDVCPRISDPGQEDTDADMVGDACDTCTDTDGDGFGNPGFPANTCATDNCPNDFNPSQTDTDGDGLGDACDPN